MNSSSAGSIVSLVHSSQAKVLQSQDFHSDEASGAFKKHFTFIFLFIFPLTKALDFSTGWSQWKHDGDS